MAEVSEGNWPLATATAAVAALAAALAMTIKQQLRI